MKFPKWVPECVQDEAKKQIEDFLSMQGPPQSSPSTLKSTVSGQKKLSDGWISEHVQRIQTLATDSRMEKVWLALSKCKPYQEYPKNLARYFDAALGAYQSYKQNREKIDRAERKSKDISEVAEHLAKLLSEFDSTLAIPDAFYSMRSLLYATKSRYGEWESLRDDICCQNVNAYADASDPHGKWMAYAWTKAPFLHECLLTLAEEARDFEPRPDLPVTWAAIDSRESKECLEYVRALHALLVERGLPSEMWTALAITAEVILDLQETVDPGNIRRAIKNHKKRSLSRETPG